MIEMLSKIWNTTLITTKSGFFISVEGIMLVLVPMLGGYLLSRLTEFFLARRLANSKIQPDVIHIIKRVSFYLILVLVALTILSVLGIPITAFAFATGAIAIGVYHWLGLKFLRQGWFNLDIVWALSLVLVGVISLATLH